MNNENIEKNESNDKDEINESGRSEKSERSESYKSENSIEETKKKQIRNLVLIVVGLACVLGILYFIISGGGKTKVDVQKAEKSEFASPIAHIDAGSLLIQKTETRLSKAEKTTEVLQKSVEELNAAKITQALEAAQEQEKINTLINRLAELEKKTATPAVVGTAFPTAPGQPGSVDGQNQPILMTQGIRDDAITLDPDVSVFTLPTKNPKDYVPSGTFVKAVTLGGADASAAVNAQANPQPMLFRIVEDGTMPNNQKSHLKGCLATAAVVGDISSERGFIRLETLSCVEPDTSRVIDLNVEGTVFGPEGKSGIRGVPMWREGALLQRAFAAGALSGLAGAMSQKYTQTSVSPLGAIQTTSGDVKDILSQGAASGLGNAMEKLADYNIRRAEQYHPVLQLSAGTVVDLVFLKGFYLGDAKNNNEGIQNRSMSTPNIENRTNNQSNIPHLTITPEQATKLNARTAELNG
jgi:conjugal transfer pilus assembly protein TraB